MIGAVSALGVQLHERGRSLRTEKSHTSDPVVGLSTVFLNSSLQPQREQGSWLLLVGSTASSWCLRQRHTVNIHCATQDDCVTVEL